LSGPEAVAAFMTNLNHPLKKTMEVTREIILSANKELTEHIKWNAPSFCIHGEDRITFNIHKNDSILIIFHRGAKVKDTKGKGPLFNDTTGLLEWLSTDRAMIKFTSLEDVSSKKANLKKVVKLWIQLTS
jgi:uncharacterized protein YdhG (YjbR/CyaY superfamily)